MKQGQERIKPEFQPVLDFSGKLPAAAQERIAQGMQTADEHANEIWKHYFDAAVLIVALRQPDLTCTDVLLEMAKIPGAPSTHNLAAAGPRMKYAVKMGIISYTNETRRSPIPHKHGNRGVVWASNRFQGGNHATH